MGSKGTGDITVESLQQHGEEVFIAAYGQYHHAVFANIRRLVKDNAAAEDLLQDVFITLWENRMQLKPAQSIDGWLFTSSYYKSLHYLRRLLKENRAELPSTDIADEVFSGDLYERRLEIVHHVIGLLPPRKRQAFRLYRLEGKTYEEVAEVLQISKESVKDYIKSSSVFIRKYITDKYPDLPAFSTALLMVYFS